MKELITGKGWKFRYYCNCGGSRREHFEHDDHKQYEIRIRPTLQTFTVIYKGMLLAGPAQGYKLENKMKELGL